MALRRIFWECESCIICHKTSLMLDDTNLFWQVPLMKIRCKYNFYSVLFACFGGEREREREREREAERQRDKYLD